jgi:hypothetical protein
MKRVHAALGAALFAFGTAAAAQTWPTTPLTFRNPAPTPSRGRSPRAYRRPSASK